MNPSGKVGFARIVAANNAEAERILARRAACDERRKNVPEIAGNFCAANGYERRVAHDHHVWPEALPDVPQWRQEAPGKPGTYRWRNTAQWEEVRREVDAHRNVYSHRFQQWVHAARVGGEWFY